MDAISFQGLPLVFGLRRRTLAGLLLLSGLGLALLACGEEGPATPPPPAEAPMTAPVPRPYSSELLRAVDLSEEAAEGMSREDLWAIGVRLLAWPEETPADLTKEEVHRRLLEAKYRDLGDWGYI